MPSLTPLHADRSSRPHDHLVVRVGAERFAVPLAAIEEALEEPTALVLPGAPSHCLGVLRWRGRRIALHDAAPVFGIAAAAPPPVALLFGGDEPVAVAVDELVDVITIVPGEVRPWSARGDVHRVIPGVAMIDGGIVALVRPEGVALAFGGAAQATARATQQRTAEGAGRGGEVAA